ncbi:MAG: cell division protein ZapA [Oscillospiraceae bacterium]|nr:cell division protein ZapA [Oscillospiraceae bacterium]
MDKHKVDIVIKNQNYTIVTDTSPEEVIALSNGINSMLDEIMASGKVTLTQALVLVSLDLAEKAKGFKEQADDYKSRIADYLEDAERAMTERDRYKRENEKLKTSLSGKI